MPFSVQLDRERHLIVISAEGDVGDTDLEALSKTARAMPEVATGIGVLYDCSGLSSVSVTRGLVQELGMRARNDTNRVAFVAPTPVAFGLARMYQIISGGEDRMQIFPDRDTALAWLKNDLAAGERG